MEPKRFRFVQPWFNDSWFQILKVRPFNLQVIDAHALCCMDAKNLKDKGGL